MTVRYVVRHGHPAPDYACQRRGIESGQRVCQIVPGELMMKMGEVLVKSGRELFEKAKT